MVVENSIWVFVFDQFPKFQNSAYEHMNVKSWWQAPATLVLARSIAWGDGHGRQRWITGTDLWGIVWYCLTSNWHDRPTPTVIRTGATAVLFLLVTSSLWTNINLSTSTSSLCVLLQQWTNYTTPYHWSAAQCDIPKPKGISFNFNT